MKNAFNKKKDFFPYNIFLKKEKKRKVYLNMNSDHIFHKKKKKVSFDIHRSLKSVAKSTKIYSDYMESYTTITQDFCFKTPSNSIYPLRKNPRYLSVASLQDVKHKFLSDQKKTNNKRPMSAMPFFYKIAKKNNDKEKLKKEKKSRNKLTERFDESIDLDNDNFTKLKNFEYLTNYISTSNYDNYNDHFNNTKLSFEGILHEENLKYQINIFSLCLKFRLIYNNGNIKNNSYQKIYIPFKYLPIIYLLDFQLFKVLLSEIIYYEQNNFCLNNDGINQIFDKYSRYIFSYIKDKKNNNIIYNKNEFLFPSCYKWFVINSALNNNASNNYLIYDLEIEFPKIKFIILNKGTIINNILKKSLLIKLMENNFESWNKTVLFELFYNKKFRNIINSIIKLDSKYIKQNLNIFPFNIIKSHNQEKIFQLFISDVNRKISRYYIFNPYKIIIAEKKKLYQQIQLNLEESKILYRLKNIWGTTYTLLKSLDIEEIKDYFGKIKIRFKLDISSNITNEYIKNLKKSLSYKKEKENKQIKMKNFEINLVNCSLKRILINHNNNNKLEEKLIEIKQELINIILGMKIEIINNSIYEKIGNFCGDFLQERKLNYRITFKRRNAIEENAKNSENDNVTENLNKKSTLISNNESQPIYIKKESKKSIKANVINDNQSMKPNLNKRRILSAKIISKDSEYIKNKQSKEVTDLLFLTKNLSNNRVEKLFSSESESSEEPSITAKYKYIESFNGKKLNQIKNQKEFSKNRIMRNSYLLKKELNYKKIKRILSAIERNKAIVNIHNKY